MNTASAHTKIVGVVNVTPDSFSDGGQWYEHASAIAHGKEMVDQGADVLDIGGESTRPGADRIDIAEEVRRVLAVLEGLTEAGVPLSVDTMRAPVAEQALEAGATIVNDVSGGRADPDMAALIAERGCTYIVSHWRGPSAIMNTLTDYDDVVADVSEELMRQVDDVVGKGVQPGQIVIGPGLGFAKDAHANWVLIAHLERLMSLGFPLLIGASRKRFLGELLRARGEETPPANRDQATAAITAIVAHYRVWGVRVHEVSPSKDAILVAEAIRMAKNG